jgi:LmbE family N-acetylglucosaminyl deacetylase
MSTKLPPLLAFGAHPDDIEFGCGGILAREIRLERAVHMVVCSRGESASNGTPAQRTAESASAAEILGAALEWMDLGGDAHITTNLANTIQLAAVIRRVRPAIVLAPSLVENQHPDHPKLGAMVRDAARLARYGGVAELREAPPHPIAQLFYYAITTEAEPRDISPILMDITDPREIESWNKAMAAHVSQAGTRNYVELAMTRARLAGLSAGVGYAMALYPADPPVVQCLSQIQQSARQF